MNESPPNVLCHTVYADRTIGLTVTALVRNQISWRVLFQLKNRHSMTLNEQSVWYTFRRLPDWSLQPAGGWSDHTWQPANSPLIPPAALAAVEAWLAGRAAEEVAP